MTPTPNKCARLKLRVVPKAKRRHTEFDGELLRVWVTAAPEKGEANLAVIELLSELLKVPKSAVQLDSGLHSRNKTARIDGIDQFEAHERLK